jgi:hypothetical protein
MAWLPPLVRVELAQQLPGLEVVQFHQAAGHLAYQLAGLALDQPHPAVEAGRDEGLAVGRHRHAAHPRAVVGVAGRLLACLEVPDAHDRLTGARDRLLSCLQSPRGPATKTRAFDAAEMQKILGLLPR